MRILLDSHAFVWFAIDHVRLSDTARAAIEDRDATVHLSAATLWEIATKHRHGKWSEAGPLLDKWRATMLHHDFRELPVTLDHGLLAGALPGAQKDPFDRMLAAQDQLDDLVLVTADAAFETFGTRTLW